MTLKVIAQRVDDWACDPAYKWRSWAGHTLMVVSLAALFGVRVAVFCYAFREMEQAWDKCKKCEPQDVRDNLLDVVVPAMALAVVVLTCGWR